MVLEPIRPKVLAVRFIPRVHGDLALALKLADGQKSLVMLTCDIDDCGYAAVDEATKKADVAVIYAKSFYAGSSNASVPTAGEFIAILAGPDPEACRSGLEAAVLYLETEACFYWADEARTVPFYPHLISSSGSYLSKMAGIVAGEALAYLIAPPVEAVYGVDAALKAADVRLCTFYGPPTETNFAGGLLTGSQSACQAATEAFRDAIVRCAAKPLET